MSERVIVLDSDDYSVNGIVIAPKRWSELTQGLRALGAIPSDLFTPERCNGRGFASIRLTPQVLALAEKATGASQD